MAQDRLEPVVIVNDRAITGYELDQRALLLSAFGVPGDPTELATEQLINERLQVQAAENLGLELDEAAVDTALDNFATARELTLEQVGQALEARGISPNTLRGFLRVQLLFREVVQARFRALATPTDADADAALAFAASRPQESVLLQEIALPNAERGEQATLELARQLSRDLNAGGSFGAAVAQYSRAPSAPRGGRLDWVPVANLPANVAGQVMALAPGEVTAAIEIPQGVTILKLLDVRTDPPAASDGAVTLTYSQLLVPLGSDASEAAFATAEAQLDEIRRRAEFCAQIDAQAEEFGPGSGRAEPTPVAALPPEVATLLAGMEPGEKEVTRDAFGVRLVMLCERSDETSPEDREALKRRLFNQRMTALGQGYLDDLRAEAVILRK